MEKDRIRKMEKQRTYIFVALIFIMTIAAGLLDYPQYYNNFQFKPVAFPEIPFKLGLDLQGGTHLIYEADLSQLPKEEYASLMQGLRDVIERRVNLFGVAEPIVQVQETAGHYRLIVELAGVKDSNQAIEMIGQTPFLEFKEVEGETFKSTILTGKYLQKAEPDFDQTTYQPVVSLKFNQEGAEIFKDLTSRNIGKPLAIFIDGSPISVPVVQEVIPNGEARITGTFNIEQAKELARNLNAGALPVPIKLISQQNVGPTLGSASLAASLRAGMFGLLAVVIFMILFYRLPGLLASAALMIYVILILALFKLIPVTLTLAGIGGFILSIGMAVDANVLIFARMREELKAARSFSAAIEEGFRRAWPSIRDGHLTALIVTLILFWFGTSFVKGFALTLAIGILMSMFSAIIITKNLLRVFVGTKIERAKILW